MNDKDWRGKRGDRETPGRYQRLYLFIQILRVLCPNLTDSSYISNNSFEFPTTLKNPTFHVLELKKNKNIRIRLNLDLFWELETEKKLLKKEMKE